MHAFLDELGIKASNPAACFGPGQFSDTTNAGVIDSLDPATGERIAQVYSASDADYERVIKRAQEIAVQWRNVPAPERGQLVRLIGDALRKHKDALGSLVALEMGKIKPEGDGEVQEMIDIADFAVGQSRMLYGMTTHSERPQHRLYEQYHPLGVVGVLTAFNFPVAVWAWNALLSAVCGNVTIWKPSPKTPLTAIAVQNICNQVIEEHGYPPVFMNFMDAKNELAGKFIDDKRIPLISFTGSCKIGRMVAERVGARLGKSLLELGGNNAIIVDKSADLKLAVPAIVFGAVGTAGQRCTTTRRLIVHRDLIDELSKTVADAYKQVRIGNPLDSNTLMGPLIDEASAQQFEKTVDAAKAAGGELLVGGNRIDGNGHFVEPTIFRFDDQNDVVREETFAPILYIMPFDKLEDAIAMQNDVPQGLSSSIFATDMRVIEQYLSHNGSDCGIANVNIGTSGAEIGGAFGGEKDTGGGRESGSDSWKVYMRRQTNTINWSNELPLAQGIKFDL
jgi:aldehyde dehydrogenase (NAD+)